MTIWKDIHVLKRNLGFKVVSPKKQAKEEKLLKWKERLEEERFRRELEFQMELRRRMKQSGGGHGMMGAAWM